MMNRNITLNPWVVSIALAASLIIGIILTVINSNILLETTSIYFTGVHTVGDYEQFSGQRRGGRYSSAIYEYSFQDTSGRKYITLSYSDKPQIEVIYNQENPDQNIPNSFYDWVRVLINLVTPLVIVGASYFGFKKSRRGALQDNNPNLDK